MPGSGPTLTTGGPTSTTSASTYCARVASRRTGSYRGEQFDSDLGLYYLRARYYNPLTGRFVSRDPDDGNWLDSRTLHKYLYAGGDPVNAFDPSGKSPVAVPRPGICGGDLGEYACAALAVTAVAVLELPQVKKAEAALFSKATSIIDCINQYLRDLAACMSAYPAGGAQQARCIKAAKQAKELCIESFTGGGGGPVN